MLFLLFPILNAYIQENDENNEPDIRTVFLQISYINETNMEKTNVDLVFDLYNKTQPKTVNNFRSLLLKKGGYKKSYFYKISGPCIIGGDYEYNSGLGGQSIYNEPFNEYTGLHNIELGSLVMIPDKEGNVKSQFFICAKDVSFVDENFTVFGKVRESCIEDLKKIHSLRTRNEKPIWPIKIEDCGDVNEEKNDL